MTTSYRIQNIAGVPRIEFQGQFHAEDELCEAIWLVKMELRNGLPSDEHLIAQQQVAQYQTLLEELRSAGA